MTYGENLGPRHILIAEDSPTQAARLRHLLTERGYDTAVAANGKEALALIRQRKPDLIISDVMMPELDGYGLSEAVKSDESLRDIPVVLVTTLSDPQDIVRGLTCGADNFIRKPFDDRYLLSRIEYLLMNSELRKNQKLQLGVEINLGGRRHFITSERQQILDLLISIYEQAVFINVELKDREKDLAQSNKVLQGLYQVADALNAATSVEAVADAALDGVLGVPGVLGGWIVLADGEATCMVAARRDLPDGLMTPGVLEGDCECRRRLLSGELAAVMNVRHCARLAQARESGLRGHASVPLAVGDRTLGVMNLVGVDEGIFNSDQLQALEGVGNQVAVALERARLHERLEDLVAQRTAALTAEVAERKQAEARVTRLNRVYAVLSGINGAIVRIRDRHELFKAACDIAVEHGRFRMAWIGLIDPALDQVVPVITAGADDGFLDEIQIARAGSLSDIPLLAELVSHKKGVVCNDLANDRRVLRPEPALRRGFRSFVMYPLLLKDEVVGVFTLYAEEVGFFDQEELTLLDELAADVSFALDFIEKEERLNYLAYYDALTGLPNRALLSERLSECLPAAREDAPLALLAVDIERFRIINSTLGRDTGDELLKQVAERLLRSGLDARYLARLNADCFAVIVPTLTQPEDAVAVLEQQVATALARPFEVNGLELAISVKAGIAVYPEGGDDAEALLRNAEAALKSAKLSGDSYGFFSPELNARIADKLTLENKLRRALEQDQLVLHYQPKVDLKSGRLSGVEALLRWNDPDRGLVPPGEFIPLLEETGLIIPAGRWALTRAMTDAVAWRAKGLAVPRIAVNISPLQLRKRDFVAVIEEVLRETGAPTEALELEITESLIMQNIEANIPKLEAMRALGIDVAVDDFGTGYSSLSYIARLPITSLKIDRAFIVDMAHNAVDLNIASTIISLAHSLNLRVIAEGVEAEEQLALLRRQGCDEIQGFLFSRPLTAEKFEQLLREGRPLQPAPTP